MQILKWKESLPYFRWLQISSKRNTNHWFNQTNKATNIKVKQHSCVNTGFKKILPSSVWLFFRVTLKGITPHFDGGLVVHPIHLHVCLLLPFYSFECLPPEPYSFFSLAILLFWLFKLFIRTFSFTFCQDINFAIYFKMTDPLKPCARITATEHACKSFCLKKIVASNTWLHRETLINIIELIEIW